MRLKYFFITTALFSIFTIGKNVPPVNQNIEMSMPTMTMEDLRDIILGEWLPLDTIRDEVYLNHHMSFILTDDGGIIYLTKPINYYSSDQCVKEEYNVDERSCTLYFVYGSNRSSPDYCYELKLIDAGTLEWYNFGILTNGEKSFYPHNSYRTIRKENGHEYAQYNNELPKEIRNKAYLFARDYRGNYYYTEYDSPFLKTYTDSIAIRDAYNGYLIKEAVKHCHADNDTIFIYRARDNTPSYRLIWLDRKAGIVLFCHPWEEESNTDRDVLIDSVKNTKELLPTFATLLEKDTERTAFFKKWKKKGYTEDEIKRFIWYRESPQGAFDLLFGEDPQYEDRDGEILLELNTDYNKDGLVDEITLVEYWLYEKDINHDLINYTICIVRKLDINVYLEEGRIKVYRPMLENFSINMPADGLLELKYDVYAKRGYDTWEYREKNLSDVDSINSYTYTYKYNGKIKDWDLIKIDAVIKTPLNVEWKSISPTGRTLYTLKENMNPLDDIE